MIPQRFVLTIATLVLYSLSFSTHILIPMADKQANHLRAYGIVYKTLQEETPTFWLLNYKGGSFMVPYKASVEQACILKNVSYEIIPDAQATMLRDELEQNNNNTSVVKLEKAAKIAVFTPPTKQPWDDAVTMALTYAEIPYEKIYNKEVLSGELEKYDWLHLHHEDFTGQYGKFFAAYARAPWYVNEQMTMEALAKELGYEKVSQMNLDVAKTIRNYVSDGHFLFAMCAATETIDIALSAQHTDICAPQIDHDPVDPQWSSKIDYTPCFAFKDFTIHTNIMEHAFSNIDVLKNRTIKQENDYFMLFDFSAKWDPIPTMLCQNHSDIVPGFMGQTTGFHKNILKKHVVVMGENKAVDEVRYMYGVLGKGFWVFYSGHDPADYTHFVGDPKTDLSLHPNSPGYRLILNNVLFPSSKPKKRKT